MPLKVVITRNSPDKSKKKKMGKSYKFAVWAAVIATLCPISSYTLAALGLEPLETLTVTIFTACLTYIGGCAGKSLYEKHDRNKFGLDENGIPFDTPTVNNFDLEEKGNE